METADANYFDAINECQGGSVNGVYRRIVQVAFLKASETNTPTWAWLEATIERFRTAIAPIYSQFNVVASYARAIALYGEVNGQPLSDRLELLDKSDANFSENVLAEVKSIDRAAASRARRRSGVGQSKGRQHLTSAILASVERLIAAEGLGDKEAAYELGLIRMALEKSPATLSTKLVLLDN